MVWVVTGRVSSLEDFDLLIVDFHKNIRYPSEMKTQRKKLETKKIVKEAKKKDPTTSPFLFSKEEVAISKSKLRIQHTIAATQARVTLLVREFIFF
jgi:hypothetical protein